MRDSAISVEGVGKWYRLGGAGEQHGLLSERVGALLRAPARLIRGRSGANPADDDRFWALRDVSMEIARGEAVGLVGANGAGKSTLLKLLSRITPPSEGRITLRGRIATLLEVGTGFHPELSGRENIYLNGAILGMRRREIDARLEEIIDFSGIEQFIDVPIKRYSSGMYVRLAFAVAAHLEPEILLVDEVLAVGDADFQRKCIGRMQEVAGEGRTVVFVSHNLAAVERLCDRCYWIRNGEVAAEGPTPEVVAGYLKAVGGAQHGGAAEIPETTPRIGGESARLTRVELRSEDSTLTDQVPIGGRIEVTARFEVAEPIDAAVVEIGLSGADGTRVVTAHSTDGGGQPFALAPGEHAVAVVLDAFLLPGDFTVDVALHDSTALTHDAVDRALAFAVLNIGAEEDRYPWATVRGAVRLPSTWSVDSLELERAGVPAR